MAIELPEHTANFLEVNEEPQNSRLSEPYDFTLKQQGSSNNVLAFKLQDSEMLRESANAKATVQESSPQKTKKFVGFQVEDNGDDTSDMVTDGSVSLNSAHCGPDPATRG